ncbi:MAG: transcriptional regulator [Methylotenera sp.]|nr:MAG: transcriptional regulator [Methylotenera sp.]PPD50044.1 MAG: transcriptional regulator [Methylotenera sp.]
MDIKKSLGLAIQRSRKARKITQEDFSEVSSRTYVSTLERGLYSPTVEKVDAIAKVIGIHPLTLLTLSYLIESNDTDSTKILNQIQIELNQLLL